MLKGWLDASLLLPYAAFWIAAGLAKAAEIPQFTIAILAYQILPPGWADGFAWAVVCAEVAAGAMLFFRRTRAAGALAALALLALFTLAVARALSRGDFHECGCKVPFLVATVVGPHLLFRNLMLSAWALFLAYRWTGSRAAEPVARALARLAPLRWRLAESALIGILLITILHQKGINERLSREVGYIQGMGISPRAPLEPGARLPPLKLTPISGGGGTRTIPFGPGEPERLFILFAPACDLCARLAPAWNDWSARGEGLAFVGVSAGDTASTRRFAEHYKIPFPVFTAPPHVWSEFRTTVVPRAIRVSPDGTVREIRQKP